MERLTNRYEKLYQEVEKEILALEIEDNELCLVHYSEIPPYGGGHFAIAVVNHKANNRYRLIKKTWDTIHDSNRFSSGVYNLDRLCIKTRFIDLTYVQQQACREMLDNIAIIPETLDKMGMIIDGVQHRLIIKTDHVDKEYEWIIAIEDASIFESIINFLKVNTEE